jgi:hypothetical protein
MNHTAISQDELEFDLYQNIPFVLERGGSFGGWEDVTEIHTEISRLPSYKRELEEAPIQSPKSRLLNLDDNLLKRDDRGSNQNHFTETQRESHSRKGSAGRTGNETRAAVAHTQQVRRVGSLESNTMTRSNYRTASTVANEAARPAGPFLRGRDHREGQPCQETPAAVLSPSPQIHPRPPQLPALARPPSGAPQRDAAASQPSQLASISKEETLLPRRSAHVVPVVDRLVLDDSDCADGPGCGARDDASDTPSHSNLSSASTQHSPASSGFRRQCRRSQQLLHRLMAASAAASRPGTRSGGRRGEAAAEAPVTVKVPSAELSRASG